MFYDADADLSLLNGKTVAIIGFGSQGHAHALNLRDSGVNVIVGLRPGSESVATAREAGLEVVEPAEASSRGDIVMMLVPDELHRAVWEGGVGDGVASGNLLLFGHGFSIHYGEVTPPADVERGTGRAEGSRPPRSPPVHRGLGRAGARRSAAGPHGSRAAAVARLREGNRSDPRGGFRDELQGRDRDRSVRRAGGPVRWRLRAVQAGFDTLVEAGYDPKMAYFECLHELKLIVNLMYEKGLSGMRFSISNTAEYGDYTRGKRVISEQTRAEMRKILGEIQSGDFAREWIAENRAGQEHFLHMREQQAGTQIEREGRELRSMMDWINPDF